MSSPDGPPANSHRLDPTSVAHPSRQQHRSASKLLCPSSKANPHSDPTAASAVSRSKQIQPQWRFEHAIHSKVRTHLAPSSGVWPTPVPRTDPRVQIQAVAIRPNSNKSGAFDQAGSHCSTPKFQTKTGDSMFQLNMEAFTYCTTTRRDVIVKQSNMPRAWISPYKRRGRLGTLDTSPDGGDLEAN
ncbi:hypothetical protein ACLOJK_014825 [Asimina triloba]